MIYRKLLLCYLQFRKKSLIHKMTKINSYKNKFKEMYNDGSIDIDKYTSMMNYREKTIDNLNGQMVELDKIINDIRKWHIVRKQKKNF